MNTTTTSRGRRAVLIPVAGFDRRVVAALHHAASIPAQQRRAMHVAQDPGAVEQLAHRWMTADIGMPLDVLDTTDPVPDVVAAAAAALLEDADEVIVVLGRQTLERRWHRVLHDRTADAIAAAVDEIPGALPVIVAVPTTPTRARSTSNVNG